MKVCPVCQAKAFDDAEVCFGCLYEFGQQGEMPECGEMATGEAMAGEAEAGEAEAIQPETGEGLPGAIAHPEALPEFIIRFVPVLEESGTLTWTCTVEQ